VAWFRDADRLPMTHSVKAGLEAGTGIVLVLLALLDVFFTVLYARIGYGFFGARLARLTRWFFRVLSRPFPRHHGRIMSFCGPALVVLLIGAWAFTLIIGNALIFHPRLGSSIVLRSGATPTGFASALYASTGSLSIANSSDFQPQTAAFQILYVVDAVIGASVVTLILMYLMQVYSALQERNALGLKIHLASSGTGDAAEVVAAFGPDERFSTGFSSLAEIAGELIRIKESHHFYPVVAYFRFPSPVYEVSRFSLVVLDAVALLCTALDAEEYNWVHRAISVRQTEQGAFSLVTTLSTHFAPKRVRTIRPPDLLTRQRWEARFAAAVQILESAGLRTTRMVADGAAAYIERRAKWHPHVAAIAPLMGFTMEEIDPAGSTPTEGSSAANLRDSPTVPGERVR
jgi:hypothetical protein